MAPPPGGRREDRPFAPDRRFGDRRGQRRGKYNEKGRWEPSPYTGPSRRELGESAEASPTAQALAEGHLLGAMFNDPSLWARVQTHVGPEEFGDARYKWLAERFWDHLRNEGEPTPGEWIEWVAAQVPPERASRVKAACIELGEAAALLGPAEAVAREMVGFFHKQRDGRAFRQMLRRGGEEGSAGEVDEAEWLRRVQGQVRARQGGRDSPQ